MKKPVYQLKLALQPYITIRLITLDFLEEKEAGKLKPVLLARETIYNSLLTGGINISKWYLERKKAFIVGQVGKDTFYQTARKIRNVLIGRSGGT